MGKKPEQPPSGTDPSQQLAIDQRQLSVAMRRFERLASQAGRFLRSEEGITRPDVVAHALAHVEHLVYSRERLRVTTSPEITLRESKSAARADRKLPALELENLLARTGMSVVLLDVEGIKETRPIEPEGTRALDWKDRFRQENHEFSEGDEVLIPAFFRLDSEGRALLVADDQDGRMADKFYPINVSGKAQQTLAQYEGIALGCVVDIKKVIKRESQLSDIHEYEVELHSEVIIPPVNPTEEQLAMLPHGARVVVEGKIVRIEASNQVGYRGSQAMHFTVELNDGRNILVPHYQNEHERLGYAGGVLENLVDKIVQTGEGVRLLAYVPTQN